MVTLRSISSNDLKKAYKKLIKFNANALVSIVKYNIACNNIRYYDITYYNRLNYNRT